MGHVLETGNPIAVADYSELPDPIGHHAGSETSAALSVPVRLDGRVIGALTVARNERYAPSERHLLSPLADELAALLPPWIISASWPADVELVIAMG
jgi:GAF domain-containing protein